MTSGGSLASLETAARFPVRLVESGPAGGAILAGRIALERGETAHPVVRHGRHHRQDLPDRRRRAAEGAAPSRSTAQSRFKKGSGLPVRIPVIEMVEIGAGGGSIARVDALQRILVGPDSAGAEPGPACYGRGGTEPTVTDADLALGKIDPGALRRRHDRRRSGPAPRRRCRPAIGAKLVGMSAEQAAVGVAEIVDENMANAARVHAVERGKDIAERTLIAFGGAAPLHASRLAEKLGIARVIVPPEPASARPSASWRRRRPTRSCARATCGSPPSMRRRANALFAAMQREAEPHARAAAGGRPVLGEARRPSCATPARATRSRWRCPDRKLAAGDAATFRADFEREYTRLFARHIPNAEIEIMSWVVLATTATEPPARLAPGRGAPAPKPVGERSVFDAGLGRRLAVPVYERDRLAPGAALNGPGADRRGRHLHLRLAALRCVRGCRRGAGADGKIVPSPRRASSARTGRGLG